MTPTDLKIEAPLFILYRDSNGESQNISLETGYVFIKDGFLCIVKNTPTYAGDMPEIYEIWASGRWEIIKKST